MPDQDFERGILFMPGGDPRFVGGFVQLPSAILRSKKLQPGEKTLYALLLDYAWGRGEAFPSQSTLAEDIGRGERHIRDWLHHLEGLDLIRIQRRGLNLPNIYWITNPPPAWLEEEFSAYLTSKSVLGADRNYSAGQERPRGVNRQPASSPAGRSGSRVPVLDRNQGADETYVKPAVLPSEDKPKVTPSSGDSVPETLEAEVDTARTRARVNSARVRAKAPPNPDVRTLLLRHAQCYQEKVGVPYPVAWGKDGAIVKRLLRTYGADELVLLQDTFFGQPADSQAALRGYTVQRLEYEAPALMPRIKLREHLTDEQREAVLALRGEGVSEQTALALVAEHSVSDIQLQLRAHQDRKDRLRNPAAALVKAVRENWYVPEEDEPDYYRPLPKAGQDGKELVPAPPWFEELFAKTVAHLTGKEVAP